MSLLHQTPRRFITVVAPSIPIRTQHTKEIPTHQHLKVNLAGRQLHSNYSDSKYPFCRATPSRPVRIAESQPALKVSFNRPRPRSQLVTPARAAGRVCWLFIFFHGS